MFVFLLSCNGRSLKVVNSDFLYIVAVDCELSQKFDCSAINYAKLYDIDKNETFLKHSISNALMSKNFSLVQRYIDTIKQKAKTDMVFSRFLIPYYVEKGEYQKAKNIAKENLKKDNSLQNQKIALALEPNKLNMNSIEILKKFYNETKDKKYSQAIVSMYIKAKDKKGLKKFLEEDGNYDDLLMDLYGNLQEYKKAENLALTLYKKNNNPVFLAKSAIYLYEPNEKNFNIQKEQKKLELVFKRFEQSVFLIKNPMYYNYYGYILIEHDKDIKKGIKLVNMALKIEPKNSYYIDSLAWGYYKNSECKKAFDILSPLKDEKQEDIQKHLKKIKQCLENK